MSSSTETVTKTVIAKMTVSGHVPNTSCVKWSADNRIAVVIDKHVYVLSSLTDPTEVAQQFPYRKSIVPNPTKPQAFDTGFDVRKLAAKCPLDEQHIIMCDPTLSGITGNSPTFLSYRTVEWSPICRDFGCLLSALTLDHRLLIYRKDFDEWKLMSDLSIVMNQSVKELWTDTDGPKFSIYRSRAFNLATNAFCWAQNWRQNTESVGCLLFLGSKNGLITFCDISIDSDLKLSPEVVYQWNTSMDQIDCLKSFDNYLLISSISGRVCVIFTNFSSDSSPNPLNLWSEEDSIRVNDFAVKQMDDNHYDIVFAKNDFIIICRFSADTTDDDKIQLSLKSCQTVPGLHQMPSTAVCPIVGSKYLLTALDGRLIEIDVSDGTVVSQKEVTLDCVNSSGMCAHGVEQSPNGVLSVLVQSLCPMHDHLVVKEPVQVVVFSNISFETLTTVLSNRYLSQSATETDGSLEDCFDYFDCIRSYLSNSLYSGLDTPLFGLIDDQNLIIGSNDLLRLRVFRFIARSYISRHLKNSTESDVYKKLESSARFSEDMILRLYILELCQTVDSRSQSLTESQLVSLKNMSSWLQKRFSEILVTKIKYDFNELKELCPICEEEVPFESRHNGRCPQSHRFDRCVNSLVLCDFVRHKYVKCVRCERSLVTHPSVWSHSSICLYCG